ncbi:MAG TPA: TonB-dependent receptor [Thermoanaerobaculia bacterium]
MIRKHKRFTLPLIAMVIGTLMAVTAGAQSTTATIRGKVLNPSGAAVAGAEINAVDTQTGFVKTVHSGTDGTYVLEGLRPGAYNIVVAAPGFEPSSQDVTVLLGQNLDMNVQMSTTTVLRESITVVGNQAVETRTSEIATNVTTQQIENLPQDDRNFLNFAAMAPGIRLSADPTRKVFAGDAQDAEQTNIFIDGVSTKNDVLQGGTSGQDSSRGNPFPQSAVQEFRVLTQNYSAQYDHASSAIITAITKSGGNQFTGQAFGFYQPKAWVSATPKNFNYSTLTTNSSYHRIQPGISLGGPIVKDHLNFFVTYEGDDEHATTPVAIPAQYQGQFGSNAGSFPSPFKQTLAFGKLSWEVASNQLVDISGNYRREHETRDFGGGTTFQSATDLRNWVYGATARDQWNNNSSLNELSLSYQKYGWNPTPLNPTQVGLNFQGCCRLGGNSTTQEFDQRRIELRDNYSFAPLMAAGTHSFQVGGNFDKMSYRVNKSLNGNPEFEFRNDPANGYSFSNCTSTNVGSSACQPFEANFGFGNPILATNNNEYGIFGEDRWSVNQHLNLNLGLRWDYESHMLDENFVTPANIVSALQGKTFSANGTTFTIPNEYFSNGSQRKPYKDELQPRFGLNYDLFANGKSVAFGGLGRFYARLFLHSTLDERYREQYPVYRIEFAAPGAPCGGAGQGLCFAPADMTVAGLNALIASGATSPEIHLLSNNTKPPYSNQFDVGFRQAFGSWLASASYNNVRGYRGITWVSATGTCCAALAPGYGAVILSDPVGKSFWYSAESISLDRPFTSQTRWGVHVVYTHAKALQNGNDLFSLDLPSAAAYARHPVPGSEPDHIVATGLFRIPFEILFSTSITLGTGPANVVTDVSQGFDLAGHEKTGVLNRAVYPPKTWGFGYRDVDFRLSKSIGVVGRSNVEIMADIFNAFNWSNYGCLDTFIGPGGNPNLGNPGCMASLGRREQLGLRVNF